jgi:hypothetical protein
MVRATVKAKVMAMLAVTHRLSELMSGLQKAAERRSATIGREPPALAIALEKGHFFFDDASSRFCSSLKRF